MRILGRTGLPVSALCVGTSSWGVPRPNESPAESDARINDLADVVLDPQGPVSFIDTSNMYGGHRSEAVIGSSIQRNGRLPAGYLVQTKLDRDLSDDSFSATRMWQSLHESQERLGMDVLPVVYLHDPEVIGFDAAMAPGGPVEVLREMKRRGLVDHIGISGGPIPMLLRFVETGWFDALVTHNRWTLVDRSADRLFDAAVRVGTGICNAAPWGAGALLGDPGLRDRYGYRPTRPAVRRAIDAIADLCEAADVPLAAAALQFSMRDERVSSTIAGISSLDRYARTLDYASIAVPDSLWSEFDAVRPAESEALDA
jgi:D-threo-aldose 1-dehydrogenase